MVPFCLVCLRELQRCILGRIFTILIFQLTNQNNLLAAFDVLLLEVPTDVNVWYFILWVQSACYIFKCDDGFPLQSFDLSGRSSDVFCTDCLTQTSVWKCNTKLQHLDWVNEHDLTDCTNFIKHWTMLQITCVHCYSFGEKSRLRYTLLPIWTSELVSFHPPNQ